MHRGKAIGGSSVLNGMLYVRGDRNDYDNWYLGYLILFLPGSSVHLKSEYFRAKAGNTGWSYDEILPYFKKSMDQKDRKLAKNTHVYGTKGPLVVETPDFKTKASLGFLKAAEKLGCSVKDINNGK